MKATQTTPPKTPLEVHIVSGEDLKRFDQLLAQHHYLGASPPAGDFLRQVIVRDGQWVALLVWGSAALKLRDREKWIGWNAAMALERLKLVVQNRRYLLLHDRGSEANLASQALAAACRALPAQWMEKYGYQPLIAESFTDPQSFHGTCYKASNWEPVGMSAGASRHRADYYIDNDHPKKLWLKEISADARSKIRAVHLAPEHAQALVDPTHGILPINQGQRRSLLDTFRQAPDPRAKNTRFRIGPVLSIVSMALLCGARQITEIARFANRLRPTQRAELGLPIKKGTRAFREVPGYSVFYEVLTRMDPEAFAQLLSQWLAGQAGSLPGALALDGKMIRDIIGTVSLVDVEDGSPIAVGIMDQKEKTTRCELRVAQQLLQTTGHLEGKTISADALHCQRDTARTIVEQGGDYLLQIKDNQPNLLKAAYAHTGAPPFTQHTKGHVRIEQRSVILGQADPLTTGFAYSRSFIRITSVHPRGQGKKSSTEERYYLSSQPAESRRPQESIDLVRAHWAGVENRNHWCRDATQGEDQQRTKNPKAVANLALIRSLNLKLLHWDDSTDWLPARRERLAWEPSLALDLLLRK